MFDFNNFREAYLERYGSTKKIVEYFRHYVEVNDLELLLSQIKVFKPKDKQFSCLTNSEDLAKFLYQMRSDFVHKVEMVFFCDPKHFASGQIIGGKHYNISCTVAQVLEIFEKSFTNFVCKNLSN